MERKSKVTRGRRGSRGQAGRTTNQPDSGDERFGRTFEREHRIGRLCVSVETTPDRRCGRPLKGEHQEDLVRFMRVIAGKRLDGILGNLGSGAGFGVRREVASLGRYAQDTPRGLARNCLRRHHRGDNERQHRQEGDEPAKTERGNEQIQGDEVRTGPQSILPPPTGQAGRNAESRIHFRPSS